MNRLDAATLPTGQPTTPFHQLMQAPRIASSHVTAAVRPAAIAATSPRPTPLDVLVGDPSAAKRRSAADHDWVLRQAGWTRTLDAGLIVYTPPADATPDEVAATQAAARRVRVRDGWVSETHAR